MSKNIKDLLLFDEQPPIEIYEECLLRRITMDIAEVKISKNIKDFLLDKEVFNNLNEDKINHIMDKDFKPDDVIVFEDEKSFSDSEFLKIFLSGSLLHREKKGSNSIIFLVDFLGDYFILAIQYNFLKDSFDFIVIKK